MAQQAETTADKCSLMSYMGAFFPDRFPHYHIFWLLLLFLHLYLMCCFVYLQTGTHTNFYGVLRYISFSSSLTWWTYGFPGLLPAGVGWLGNTDPKGGETAGGWCCARLGCYTRQTSAAALVCVFGSVITQTTLWWRSTPVNPVWSPEENTDILLAKLVQQQPFTGLLVVNIQLKSFGNDSQSAGNHSFVKTGTQADKTKHGVPGILLGFEDRNTHKQTQLW